MDNKIEIMKEGTCKLCGKEMKLIDFKHLMCLNQECEHYKIKKTKISINLLGEFKLYEEIIDFKEPLLETYKQLKPYSEPIIDSRIINDNLKKILNNHLEILELIFITCGIEFE